MTPSGALLEHPGWAPDGRSIIFNAVDGSPEAGTIYTLDLDHPGATPVVVLDPASGWGGVKPSWSPDGSRIVFACVETAAPEDGICLMDADGTNVTRLVDDPGTFENFPPWGVTSGG